MDSQTTIRPADTRTGYASVVLRFQLGSDPAGKAIKVPIQLAERLCFDGFAHKLTPLKK